MSGHWDCGTPSCESVLVVPIGTTGDAVSCCTTTRFCVPEQAGLAMPFLVVAGCTVTVTPVTAMSTFVGLPNDRFNRCDTPGVSGWVIEPEMANPPLVT